MGAITRAAQSQASASLSAVSAETSLRVALLPATVNLSWHLNPSESLEARHCSSHVARSHPAPLPRGPLTTAAAHAGPSTAQDSKPGIFGIRSLSRTWSNPSGDVLTEVVPGQVWAAERPFLWNGIDVGGRMAVVLLGDGSLLVHSPVLLDDSLREALRLIGPVKHIVSPNTEHCKYAQQWIAAFPEAKSYACPGLQDQRPDIIYSESVGQGDVAPPDWLGEFQVTFIDCERNPFTGKPFFNEVIFHHGPSKTLFVTDFFWNYPESGLPLGTAAWKFGMDRIYHPFYFGLMVTSKSKLEERVNRVLSQDWETLVPCHGSVVTADAKDTFARSIAI